MKANRPQRSNNPFALMQLKPSRWKGLVSVDRDGFLNFINPVAGVRAGFINLFQAYLYRGYDTIEKIFPLYLGNVKDEKNNPDLYVKLVSEFTGIPPNKQLTNEELFIVGRAIERVEEGRRWVSDKDFVTGWKAAKMYLNE